VGQPDNVICKEGKRKEPVECKERGKRDGIRVNPTFVKVSQEVNERGGRLVSKVVNHNRRAMDSAWKEQHNEWPGKSWKRENEGKEPL
jgi:hypothetical protein